MLFYSPEYQALTMTGCIRQVPFLAAAWMAKSKGRCPPIHSPESNKVLHGRPVSSAKDVVQMVLVVHWGNRGTVLVQQPLRVSNELVHLVCLLQGLHLGLH